jgi:hypothetical protein
MMNGSFWSGHEKNQAVDMPTPNDADNTAGVVDL